VAAMNLIMMTDVQTKQLENLAEPLNMVGFTSKKHGEYYCQAMVGHLDFVGKNKKRRMS